MKKYALLMVLVFCTSLAFSQETVTHEDFPFFVDVASFPDLANKGAYTELYFALFGENLKFYKTDSGEEMARFIISTEIYDDSDSLIDTRKWVKDLNKKNLSGGSTPLFPMGYLKLNPGKYKLKTILLDGVAQRQRIVSNVLEVPDFYTDTNLKISNLEFAYMVKKAENQNPYVKNGLMVVPNPSRLYTIGKNLLYVYYEVINVAYDEGKASTLSISYEIEDNMGNVVKKYNQDAQKPGSSAILYKTMNIATLKPGLYNLVVKVQDNENGQVNSTFSEFEVFREQTQISALEGEGVTELTPEQSEMYKHLLSAVGEKNELKIYESLNNKDKVIFINNFWKKRDIDPNTPENEFKNEMLRRWNYVKKYSRPQREGYTTDRGKKYLELGEPDMIDKLPEMGLRPHEIWRYYNLQIVVVFADLRGTDVFRMISEQRKDGRGIYDPNWQDRLDISTAGFK